MNLPFDIQYLRMWPEFRAVLGGRHILIDLSVVNFLENEQRPEKSLKSLGLVLGTHRYEDEDGVRDGNRYPLASDRDMHRYNGQDTHNTLIGVANLAQRIHDDFADTDKLSPFCVRFYSDSIWSVIRMSEAGIPMNYAGLSHLERTLLFKCNTAHTISSTRYGTPLQGKGSANPKKELMNRVCDFIAEEINPDIRDHPLFEVTEKLQEISVNDVNRRLFQHHLNDFLEDHLPGQHTFLRSIAQRHLRALELLGTHISSQKLVSSYTYPLLRHARSKPTNQSSVLIPHGAPSWTAMCKTLASSLPTNRPDNSLSSPTTHSNGSSQTTSTVPSTCSGKSSGPKSANASQSATKKRSRLSPRQKVARRSTSVSQTLSALTSLTEPPPSQTETEKAPGKTQRRKRSEAQWKKRHTERKLRRNYSRSNKKGAKLRVKAASPSFVKVDYSPLPIPPKTTLPPPPTVPLVGLVHPSWYVVPSYVKDASGDDGGTAQSRIVAKGPAAQTFPSDIKQFFISRWTDGLIVGYDLSQIEMKTAALLSGDTTLMAAYEPGAEVDLHSDRAFAVFGHDHMYQKIIEETNPSDPDAEALLHKNNEYFHDYFRQPAKHCNFGDLFRAGPDKLQWIILKKGNVIVPLHFFQKVVEQRPNTRPGLWAWQEELIDRAHTLGYLDIPFTGQSRFHGGGEKYDVNEIVNQPIQTTASNALLRIQAYIHQHGQGMNVAPARQRYHMCHNIYDAIIFDVRSPDHLEEVDNLVASAVNHVQTRGYWAAVQDYCGREVEITYDRTIYAGAEAA